MNEPAVVLQKLLALRAGVSRREATRLIEQGRVRVNGRPAELGMRAKSGDRILLNGQELIDPHPVILAYYKPVGVVSTLRDPHARYTLTQNLPPGTPRVVPAGRLDKESEGLMILSNDGELVMELTHPSFVHEKEYEVTVERPLSHEAIRKLRTGIKLAEGIARVDRCQKIAPRMLKITLHQGWRRQIRRMLEREGHAIRTLKRIRIGKLTIGKMQPGQVKEIRRSDIL